RWPDSCPELHVRFIILGILGDPDNSLSGSRSDKRPGSGSRNSFRTRLSRLRLPDNESSGPPPRFSWTDLQLRTTRVVSPKSVSRSPGWPRWLATGAAQPREVRRPRPGSTSRRGATPVASHRGHPDPAINSNGLRTQD